MPKISYGTTLSRILKIVSISAVCETHQCGRRHVLRCRVSSNLFRRSTIIESAGAGVASVRCRDHIPVVEPVVEHVDRDGQRGSLPGFHLMLQPMLGCWSPGTSSPASTASRASVRSAPVTD